MRVLLVHNYYQQPGGEDEIFRAEARLLRAAGHDVLEHTRTNDDIQLQGPVSRLRVAVGTIWAGGEADQIAATIGRFNPDVVHFHNTFPLISPAGYHACHRMGVAVVQTLHNYRLSCPAATHLRDGRVCTECSDKSLVRSVGHACYRGSRSATATVAAMLAIHRGLNTWTNRVDAYIVMNEFARERFLASGLPGDRLFIKPNFVEPDPGPRSAPGDGALFVGRLSAEKGVATLVRAWHLLSEPPTLTILGGGPEHTALQTQAAGRSGIHFRGHQSRVEVTQAMKAAQFLVFPSVWFEGLPMTILEAFACGVPVIASRLGTMADLIMDRRTGLHFTAGDARDLADKVEWAATHPEAMATLGRQARADFEARYTAGRNLDSILDIYDRAIAGRRRTAQRGSSPAVFMRAGDREIPTSEAAAAE
jgi:glycosyltransferase involved in cell wall biosynthesis